MSKQIKVLRESGKGTYVPEHFSKDAAWMKFNKLTNIRQAPEPVAEKVITPIVAAIPTDPPPAPKVEQPAEETPAKATIEPIPAKEPIEEEPVFTAKQMIALIEAAVTVEELAEYDGDTRKTVKQAYSKQLINLNSK